MTEPQRAAMYSLLLELEPTTVHHGCCVGADREFVLAVIRGRIGPTEDRPWAEVHAHPSDLGAMTDGDALAWSDVTYKPLPPLHRNHVIVNSCDLLVACPAGPEEQQRSGTWATIRYARKTCVPARIISPDGVIETVGPSQLREAVRDAVAQEQAKHREATADLLALVGRLLDGIRRWAAEEDGIPDWLYLDYERAKALLGRD